MKHEPPSLETTDDGLLMRSGGDWTYTKLHFVNEYLYRFIVSMRGKNWRAIHYIDLFAGPGRNRLDNSKIVHGSPILALAQPRPFDRYFFADLDRSNAVALEQRCRACGFDMSKIQIFADDANKVVNEVCNYIRERDKEFIPNTWQCLNLAFLDPEGLELHWETVAQLASYRTDMIIYYPQMAITRNADTSPEAIDRFFGDSQWRQIYSQYKRKEERYLHRALLDHYKDKLKKFGYVEDPLSEEPLFTNSKEVPLYRLLFVSKHELGNKFWKDVIRKLPNGQIRLI